MAAGEQRRDWHARDANHGASQKKPVTRRRHHA
jgi:hypothetical protein